MIISCDAIPHVDFNKDRILPLGIRTAEGGEFKLSIDELENIPSGFEIYVRDSVTGKYHDLRSSEFKANAEKGTIDERYSIVFSKEENPDEGDESEETDKDENGDSNGDGDGDGKGNTDEETEEENEEEQSSGSKVILLYSGAQKNIIIKNPDLVPISKATLYNGLGQELKIFDSIPLLKVTTLPVDVGASGIYFIKLTLQDGSASLKFLVE